jgi:hypothetical protein
MIREAQLWMQPAVESIDPADGDAASLVDDVERFFEEFLHTRPVAFPSARAALSAIFTVANLTRARTVYAPPWSSHCLWDTIGRYANPTSRWSPGIDAAIVVHKWGHVTRLDATRQDLLIIEDSVDSLLTGPSGLFPNHGSFEIQSLPKLIGSYSGGLAYCRSGADRKRLVRLRATGDASLARTQDALKFEAARSQADPARWHPWEWRNFALTSRAVKDIQRALPRYRESVAVCTQRMTQLQVRYPMNRPEGRVPTVWVTPIAGTFPVMHVDVRHSVTTPQYVKAGSLPIHAGISEREFSDALRDLLAPTQSATPE